jgi:hypothetical protein
VVTSGEPTAAETVPVFLILPAPFGTSAFHKPHKNLENCRIFPASRLQPEKALL